MTTAIDTTKVTGRRTLRFNSLEDILADVEQLIKAREIRTRGNWSAGQVVQHLAITTNKSIDGFNFRVPWPIRLVLPLLLKRRFLTQTMSAGFNLSGKAEAEMVSPPIGLEEAARNFREAVARLQTESKREPHPAIGKLTAEEWEQLHCRHSELHLSFLVPVS
jgi:hypothetical protein